MHGTAPVRESGAFLPGLVGRDTRVRLSWHFSEIMQNRIAFITGASRGIGRACALALSSAGARIVLAARQLDKLEQVAAEIRAAGRDAFVVPMDLGVTDSIRAAFAKTAKEFGRID